MNRGRNGVVVWEGKSLLDPSAPIAVVLTGFSHASRNTKTGDMLQATVIRTDMNPSEAIKGGHDDAICGNCAHRSGSNIGRSCYVVWWQAPLRIYQALPFYERATVKDLGAELLGRQVRITSYGDAAAVPSTLWFDLVARVRGWTGYTSQWRTCEPALKTILMASVVTPAEQVTAQAMGWRTFRTRREDDLLAHNEIICPASLEGDYRTTCDQCGLCGGTMKEAKSIAILPHGQRVKWLTPIA